MDLVFEHVKADRGIILLLDPRHDNELVPQVVRTRDENQKPEVVSRGSEVGGRRSEVGKKRTAKENSPPTTHNPQPTPSPTPKEKIHASRTIINHVLTTGEGVLSSNAMTDQRFNKGKSVHNLGIRSALCVPIKRASSTAKTPAMKSSA